MNIHLTLLATISSKFLLQNYVYSTYKVHMHNYPYTYYIGVMCEIDQKEVISALYGETPCENIIALRYVRICMFNSICSYSQGKSDCDA